MRNGLHCHGYQHLNNLLRLAWDSPSCWGSKQASAQLSHKLYLYSASTGHEKSRMGPAFDGQLPPKSFIIREIVVDFNHTGQVPSLSHHIFAQFRFVLFPKSLQICVGLQQMLGHRTVQLLMKSIFLPPSRLGVRKNPVGSSWKNQHKWSWLPFLCTMECIY